MNAGFSYAVFHCIGFINHMLIKPASDSCLVVFLCHVSNRVLQCCGWWLSTFLSLVVHEWLYCKADFWFLYCVRHGEFHSSFWESAESLRDSALSPSPGLVHNSTAHSDLVWQTQVPKIFILLLPGHSANTLLILDSSTHLKVGQSPSLLKKISALSHLKWLSGKIIRGEGGKIMRFGLQWLKIAAHIEGRGEKLFAKIQACTISPF